MYAWRQRTTQSSNRSHEIILDKGVKLGMGLEWKCGRPKMLGYCAGGNMRSERVKGIMEVPTLDKDMNRDLGMG